MHTFFASPRWLAAPILVAVVSLSPSPAPAGQTAQAAPAMQTAPAAPAPAAPRLDGLYQGSIDHVPGMIEWDLLVEIAPAADGRLVGTLDIPAQRMRLHPLAAVSRDGSRVSFEFDRFPGKQVSDNRFRFEGQLTPDGQTITGFFLGHTDGMDLHSPFTLHRIANAGGDRPADPAPLAVTTLGVGGGELRAAFNRDRDKIRVVVLLSPTCGSCLSGAHIVEKYLLQGVHDDAVRVYAVWGSFLGDENEAHAREATVFLADPRVTHFWTPTQEVAEIFARTAKLPAGERGWDTIQLFPRGATWTDAPPAPSRVWRVNRPPTDPQALDGRQLRTDVCDAVKTCAP